MGSILSMKLLEVFGDRIKTNEPLKNHTTYRIGGPADFYFSAATAEEASQAVRAARADGLPVFILGGGSNILVANEGFRGLVVSYGARRVSIEGNRVIADAGAVLFSLVRATVDASLSGLEWAAGIPGTVGGAVRGNAGAYGGEIKDNLDTAQAIDLGTGELHTFARHECAFSYRESFFKGKPWLITRAAFTLPAGDKEALRAKVKDTIALRCGKQPLEFGSAGSVFKSHVFGEVAKLPKAVRDDVPAKFIEYGRIPAAWFIEQLGLKGKKIGEAQISEKHANYFVNTGHASATDVRELIGYAKMKVKEAFDVTLEEEIQYVGF